MDTKKIIKDLGDINSQVGFTYTAVVNAIKVVRMWEEIRKRTCINVMCGERIKEYTKELEEEFFPTIVYQTIKVAIQGESEQRLRNTIETIECVEGVNEVRQ